MRASGPYVRLQSTSIFDRIRNGFQSVLSFGVGSGPAQNSFKVCNIPIIRGGIPLHIHNLWLLFVIFSVFSALPLSPVYALYTFILCGPILFLTVLIHELGHALMAIKLGGEVNLILLWPLGGICYISYFGESSPYKDALIAIAGPLTHFPQIGAWFIILYLLNGNILFLTNSTLISYLGFWSSLCSGAILIQIALFLWNLIPAYPLDGGRLLTSFLNFLKIPTRLSYKISAIVGAVWIFITINIHICSFEYLQISHYYFQIFGLSLLSYSITTILSSTTFLFSSWSALPMALFILNNCYQLWKLSGEPSAHHPGYQVLHSLINA